MAHVTYFDTVGGGMHLQKSRLQSAIKQKEEEIKEEAALIHRHNALIALCSSLISHPFIL